MLHRKNLLSYIKSLPIRGGWRGFLPDALVTTLAIEAAQGSYFYCIKGNGKVIKNGKLIIVK
jgi:hypothetical protein